MFFARHLILGAFLAVVLTTTAQAEAPKAVVEANTDVVAGSAILLDARKSSSDSPLQWRQLDNRWQTLPTELERPAVLFDKDGQSNVFLMVPSAQAGRYRFMLVCKGTPVPVDKQPAPTLDVDIAIVEIVVSDPTPTPPGPPIPVPPGPPVPPQPPVPTPASKVVRTVVLTDVRGVKPTSGQLGTLGGQALWQKLESECPPEGVGTAWSPAARNSADPSRRAWRYFDRSTDVTGESQAWQDAVAQAKQLLATKSVAYPAIVVFTDHDPIVATIPSTDADAVAIFSTLQPGA